MKAKTCFLVLVSLCLLEKIFGQEKEADGSTPTELDPVTISASLNPARLSTTGRNMVVVKGEQMAQLPVHSLDELLRYLPGVEVQQRGGMGSQADIVLRGGTFQQVLVILDGVRLNDPNTGHFNSYIPIAPAEIERIEIVKGASSAIYGSEAVGGVIQIITKTYAAAAGQMNKQVSAQGTVGGYGLVAGNFGGFFQRANTAVGGGFLSNNSDGQPQRGTDGFFNNHTLSFSVHQFIDKYWSLSARSAYDDRKFSAQNFYTAFVSDTAREEVKTFWNTARVLFKKSRNNISLDLGYKKVKDEYLFNTAAKPNLNKSELFQSTLTYTHTINQNNILTTGGQFQSRNIHSNDRGDHDIKQAAAFALFNKSIGDFHLLPVIRIDWDARAGTEFVPQINFSYRKQKFAWRGSAGKTIRRADFTERFNNYNKTFVSSGSIGNPSLKAEGSFSYETGMDYFLNASLKIASTIFRREQKNLIDWSLTPYSAMPRKSNLSPAGNYLLAKNLARVKTTGFETDIHFTKSFKNGQSFWANLGFVWLDDDTDDGPPTFYISSHSKFLTNFNIVYTLKNFSFNINGLYKKRTPQTASAIQVEVEEHSFILNVRLDVFLLPHRLSVFAEADNLTNEDARDLLNSLKPARWMMAGVRLNFQK